MFYQKKKRRGRAILAICVLLLFAGFTYGYMSNKQPQERPNNIAELSSNDKLETNNPVEPVEADGGKKNVDAEQEETDAESQGQDADLIDKVNDGTQIILNTHYLKTRETDTKKIKTPITLIGATLSEFEAYIKGNYKGWKVKALSANAASLYKEVDGYKPDSFIIQSKDGYIVIYKINKSGEKELYEETGISLSTLSETDKKKLDEGIYLKTIEDVYNIIEDYSS